MRTLLLGCILAVSLLSCNSPSQEAPKDLLLGKWKVSVVERGGELVGGAGFNGAQYEFRADSTVLAMSSGDTISVQYGRSGQALIYKFAEGNERYRIDELSETTLKIFSDVDGIPTTSTLVRVLD